jgi:hypothetical protein
MTDLCRYFLHDVLVAATGLRDEFDAGRLSRLEFAVKLNDFRFRDEEGDYWFLDARTIQWYCFDRRQWQPTGEDPKVLEGPVSPTLKQPIPIEDGGPQLEPLASGDGAEDWALPEILVRIARVTRTGYERGRTSSNDVEEMLAGQVLLDGKGQVWAVGVRSGQWYYVEDGQWQLSQVAPSSVSAPGPGPDSLQCTDCGALVEQVKVCQECGTALETASPVEQPLLGASILQFLFSSADRLPETVTDPWDPPAGFPEPLIEADVQCPSCSARNPPGSRFCNQCGSRLGCPNCGTVNPPHHRFCYHCGAALDE